jgi:hypothetical protein
MQELMAEKAALAPRIQQLGAFLQAKESPSVLLSVLGQGLPLSIALDQISLGGGRSEPSSGQGLPALEETARKKRKGKIKKGGKQLTMKGVCYLGSAEKETNEVSGWVQSLASRKILSDYYSEIKLEDVTREKIRERSMTRFTIVGD